MGLIKCVRDQASHVSRISAVRVLRVFATFKHAVWLQISFIPVQKVKFHSKCIVHDTKVICLTTCG